jgi:hypothetical protein
MRAGETVSWSGGCGPDGRATGHGVVEWTADGKVDRSEGDYAAGRLNGRGVVISRDGHRAEGEFRDGTLNGRGVVTAANGNRSEGEFRDGKPNGRGVLTMSDGTRYEGEFRNGKAHGFGTLAGPYGKVTGAWTNGCYCHGGRTAWVGTTREQCGF